MQIGRVVGNVVASQKVEQILGHKLLVLQAADLSGAAKGQNFVVASDSVGAGEGELVLYCQGSSSRLTALTEGKPVDAVVMAIIDEITYDGELTFQKNAPLRTSAV